MNKSYFVRYLTRERESCLVVLPNWWKLVWWMVKESRKCAIIHIWVKDDS